MVTIKNLFYREKVKKSQVKQFADSAEIKRMLVCLALIRPDIAFSLEHLTDRSTQQLLNTSHQNYTVQVLQHLYGDTEAVRNLSTISYSGG